MPLYDVQPKRITSLSDRGSASGYPEGFKVITTGVGYSIESTVLGGEWSSQGSSDSIADRPSATLFGKGSWQVGIDTYNCDGIDFIPPVGEIIFNDKVLLTNDYLADKAISTSGVLITAVNNRAIDYIPVNPVNRYYINGRYLVQAGTVMVAFKDAGGTFISGYKPTANTTYTSLLVAMPSNAAFMAITMGTSIVPSIEVAIPENKPIPEAIKEIISTLGRASPPIVKTFAITGVEGLDADFIGQDAIGRALASIVDASPAKRYELRGSGVFYFTTHDSLLYSYDGYPDEKAAVVLKDYVDIVGTNVNDLVIAVELADNLAINYGWYQPVIANANAKLKNCTIIAKNCRYAVHYDGGSVGMVTMFENCYVWHKGNYGQAAVSGGGSTAWTTVNAFGCGIGDGQTLKLDNVRMRSEQSGDFKCHSSLTAISTGGKIIMNNPIFEGPIEPLSYDVYPNNKIVNIDLKNPNYRGKRRLRLSSYVNPLSTVPDSCELRITSDTPIAYSNTGMVGKALRITSKSTGVASIITVDSACTAFAPIIGDLTKSVAGVTPWLADTIYGYTYKNGLVGTKGYLAGGIDIDSSTSHRSLGKRLGNCSVTNKTLSLTVDGVAYNVVFNTDLTAATNAAVIALIVAVIGAVADVDEWIIGREHFPMSYAVNVAVNGDTIAILAGMGVVVNGVNTVRAALTGDGYIDGIALDDAGVTGKLRYISAGEIYSFNANERFKTLEVLAANVSAGVGVGISTTQPGYFDVAATPQVLRAIDTNILKFV